jgi:hypothetical protein
MEGLRHLRPDGSCPLGVYWPHGERCHWNEADPQLAHRDWLISMDSVMVGTQTTERHPARWFDGSTELRLPYGPAPYLGEHNFEVFEDLLGWDAADVAEAIGDELLL